MMKVLVLTNMYPNAENPVLGIFVKQQVESLRAKGLSVDVLFVNGPKSTLNYVRGVRDVARAVRGKSYDLIHAHYVFSGYLARTQLRCPIVLTHHGPEVVTGWQQPLCRLITPLVDRVIAVSAEVKSILGDPWIQVIPCGVDLSLFRPMDQRESRRALRLPEDRKLVLWAAAISHRKRFDRAQRAMSLLRERMPEAELVVASGRKPELVPLYMNACDALLLTSDAEGSPQVVKEAMACNLPVVSVDVGDVAEVIGRTDGCYVCDRDPLDIAIKLESALRRGRRTEGRRAVLQFNLSTIADRVIDVYQDLTSEKMAERSLLPWRDSA